MTSVISFGQTVLSAIQKYALAKDKKQFLNSLPEGLQKNILNALALPHEQELIKKLRKVGVPEAINNEIVERKKFQRILNASSAEQIQDIIDELYKKYENSFNVRQPPNQNKKENYVSDKSKANNQQQQMININEKDNSDLSQKIQGSKDLIEHCTRLFNQQKSLDINIFDKFVLRNLSEQTLLNLKIEHKVYILQKSDLLVTYSPQFVAKMISSYVQYLIKREVPNFQIPIRFYQNLTAAHINKLAQYVPRLWTNQAFTNSWFSANYLRKYPVLSSQNNSILFAQKQEKRRVLQSTIKELQTVKQNIVKKSMIKQIQRQLLSLDLQLQDPSLQKFVKFIQDSHPSISSLFSNQWITMKSNEYTFSLDPNKNINNLVNLNFLNSLPSSRCAFNSLISDYITALLKKYGPQKYAQIDKKMMEIFQVTWYKKLKAQALMSKGEQDIDKMYTQNQKVSIRDKKQLTICKSNQKQFKVQQQVVLKIKIKNITKLNVKIYQINLQKHYISGNSDVNDTLNLQYLDPTHEFTFDVEGNDNPFKQQVYDMPIKQIKKQRGVYIVDIEGSGISSRAIIRKGSIFCLTKINLAGIQLRFYDESGKKLQQLNLWVRDQLVKVKSSLKLPFGYAQQNLRMIAVLGQYAEVITVTIPQQAYRLSVKTYYNKQSFIVGGKAKIILNPKLYLNQNKPGQQTLISLKMLKDIRINVYLFDTQSSKSVISLENVNWMYQQDYVIQIPIQSYLRQVRLEVNANVVKYNKEKQQLSYGQSIQINCNNSVNQIKNYYLSKKLDNYILQARGMNGEPISKTNVNLAIYYKWINKAYNFIGQTDKNGQLKLGPLTNVQKLMVQQYVWNIGAMDGTAQLLNRYSFREGQQISIPLPPLQYKLALQTDVNLFSMQNRSYNQKLTDLVKITQSQIKIQGLLYGNYLLNISSLSLSISIVVVKGKQWQDQNQIYNPENSTVYQFSRNPNNYLNLSQAEIIKQQQSRNNKVIVKITKPDGVALNQSTKAHVFAYNFIPKLVSQSSIEFTNKSDAKSYKFNKKVNSYLSNKKLSEEATYVFSRKQQKQYVGNNLQKPHILLKTILVRDTVQKQQQMGSQGGFADIVNKNNNNNIFDPFDAVNYPMSSPPPSQANNYIDYSLLINSHLNFFKNSGIIIENVKAKGQQLKLQFELPNCYNFFTVVLATNTSEIKRNYTVDNFKPQIKDLSHRGLSSQNQKEGTAWSLQNQIYTANKGYSYKIQRGSQWRAVSLNSIAKYAKIQGIILQDWVQKWTTFSEEQKLQVYNKKACHQINNYIKHQDVQFFNKYVKSFILNKINKTFVDLCLLQSKQCQKWIPLHCFKQLNYFQKVLLIQYLAKNKKINEAKNLSEGMQLEQKINKINYSTFKQKFQDLFNINSPESPRNIPPPPLAPSGARQPAVQSARVEASTFGSIPSSQTKFNNLFGMSGPSSSAYIPPPPPGNMGNIGGLFGSANLAPPPPPMMGMPMSMPMTMTTTTMHSGWGGAMTNQQQMRFSPSEMIDQTQMIQQRNTYVQKFKEVQKTQEFTQVTYDQIKSLKFVSKNYIPQSKFWSDLASYFANNKNNNNFENQSFMSDSIMYLTPIKAAFMLALAFIPNNINPEYQISSQQNNLVLTANKPFLLLIKQTKLIPYTPKSGMMINHRFIDPNDRYIYQQDGSRIQKDVEQFIIGKQYCLQTLVTNTTANNLQIQLLVDLPQGAIPLQTRQYTLVKSQNINAYSTQSFERKFYFPAVGQFSVYPANACWVKNVIAKAAKLPKLIVKAVRTSKKLDTLADIIQQGQTQDVIKYLQTKNIYDDKAFRPHQILWMLKDKTKYQKIIKILRARCYTNISIWRFSLLHKDLQAIKQLIVLEKNKDPFESQILNIFEYYPYYSSRAHKYQDEGKSKIRNIQFKQTYYRFLFQQITYFKGQQKPSFILAAAYYLLLQDRIDQAAQLVKNISQAQMNQYKLQYDYLLCFLDMYEGSPSFAKARKISEEYTQYPIVSWRVLFDQIKQLLRNYDNTVYVQEQKVEKATIQYRTTVRNQGQSLIINIPQNTRVQVLIYTINLQLIFSQNPFSQVKPCSSIKPAKIVIYQPGKSRQQILKRPKELKDAIVTISQSGNNSYLKQVKSISWPNPELKVKINEKKGSLQVFYQNKSLAGNYCKVYSRGSKGDKFYRDGYTDITGTFKYALSQLKEINMFSVLCMSNYGGIVNQIKPPSRAGQFI